MGPQPPLRTSHFDGISVSVSLAKGKRYWGTQRVARVCQVSPATVANWIDQGLLKGHKTPTGRRRVDAQDLTSFLRAHAMAVPTELEGKNGHDVGVVVDDDPGYLKALVMMIERSEPDVEGVEAAAGEGGVIGLLAYLVVLAASAERAAGEPHRATPKKGPLVTAT